MILDLTNKENTEINYEISKFPDGQQSVDILSTFHLESYAEIKSRLSSFKDLEIIISTTASLRECGVKNIKLYIPYFIGGRSDRKFEDGGSNYIKDVISPIINLQNYDEVCVLDPHSDVIEACINNFKKIDNNRLVNWAFRDLTNDIFDNDIEIISPDAGAVKKVFNNAKELDKENIIIASKHRDLETGNITHTEVPIKKFHKNRFVIIDDICDGGRTFIEIAKAILKQRQKAMYGTKIYLIVTHGIFSKGFKELNKYFDGIYTTNSYVDINDDNFSLINDNKLHKVKQLNIF